jgi:hypothetical protein
MTRWFVGSDLCRSGAASITVMLSEYALSRDEHPQGYRVDLDKRFGVGGLVMSLTLVTPITRSDCASVTRAMTGFPGFRSPQSHPGRVFL